MVSIAWKQRFVYHDRPKSYHYLSPIVNDSTLTTIDSGAYDSKSCYNEANVTPFLDVIPF